MRTKQDKLVVIFGLSDDPGRYAYKAASMLGKHAFSNVRGIHPKGGQVLDVPVVPRIEDIQEPIDTLTMYIGPSKSRKLEEAILAAKPRRIIFNPGSENESLAQKAEAQGIEVEEACTLVLLSTGQF